MKDKQIFQNHMTKIITNQRKKEFVTLLSNPIENKKVLVVMASSLLIKTGSLGKSMISNPIEHISSLLGGSMQM